jgi:WD40 repeat protein
MTSGQETQWGLDFRYGQDLAFSPDGKLFAAASDFGLAKVWETASRREVASIRSVLLGMHSLAFSPEGRRLAIGGNGAEAIKLWDLNSRHELLSLAASGTMFNATAFSSSGNVLGSLNREGVLHLWRAPSWAEIETAEKTAPPGR